MNKENLDIAHKKSIYHKRQIIESEICGCFHCLAIFPPSSICEWTDTNKEEDFHTALCPECGIDSVLGSKSEYQITKEFLTAMQRRWF